MYPTSTIWLVGHSLGGALASLLGSTFGLPAVAFESPGERLAAHRLRLPLPPSSASYPFSSHPDPFGPPYAASLAPITHVYHTADPIAQGTCTGIGSPCVAGGFALETRCHLGKSIIYDTVGKLCWRADVRKHTIREVIINVIERGWDIGEGWEVGADGSIRDVPSVVEEVDCVVSCTGENMSIRT